MKFVALVSGGKDSCYNILHCLCNGHELAAMANLHPANLHDQELDSFMFQTVGHDIVSLYAKCVDDSIPLFRQPIKPQTSKNVDLNYTPTETDEIEDLFALLSKVKTTMPEIEAVSVGAILSSYQRTRVEDVCARLGLTCLSYLWQRNQLELMQEMCSISKTDSENTREGMPLMDARLIKVAAVGLDNTHLGKSLPQVFPTLLKLNKMYEVHICGEGGEFETMVLDAPFFTKGYLQITSLQYINEDSAADGVFNAKLNIEFVPRQIESSVNFVEILQKHLIKPALFEIQWSNLIEKMASDLSTADPAEISLDALRLNKTLKIKKPTFVSQVGDKLYISNLKPERSNDSLENQSTEVFQQLDALLKENNISTCQVVSTSLLLQDMSNFATVNKFYNNYFNVWESIGPLPPARACVGSDLIEGALQLSCVVDLDVDVVNIQKHLSFNKNKSGLHVQGRSYWCPCNIGPYSQAIWNIKDLNQVTYISGQISLVPSSMTMVNDGKSTYNKIEQAVLSLRHFDTIKKTTNALKQLLMVCYVTDLSMVPIASEAWKLYSYQMSQFDEECFEKEDDPNTCLTIVLVSQLPRNALCEWGGIACKETNISKDFDDTDDDDDDIDCKNIKPFQEAGDLCKLLKNAVTSVTNTKSTNFYGTVFFEDLTELEKFLSVIEKIKNISGTLYYNPSKLATTMQNDVLEFYPVKQVFDYNGVEKVGAIQIKFA
ncbi:hypothetical protein ACO0RG_002588 [Hanseniaspora osmophila]